MDNNKSFSLEEILEEARALKAEKTGSGEKSENVREDHKVKEQLIEKESILKFISEQTELTEETSFEPESDLPKIKQADSDFAKAESLSDIQDQSETDSPDIRRELYMQTLKEREEEPDLPDRQEDNSLPDVMIIDNAGEDDDYFKQAAVGRLSEETAEFDIFAEPSRQKAGEDPENTIVLPGRDELDDTDPEFIIESKESFTVSFPGDEQDKATGREFENIFETETDDEEEGDYTDPEQKDYIIKSMQKDKGWLIFRLISGMVLLFFNLIINYTGFISLPKISGNPSLDLLIANLAITLLVVIINTPTVANGFLNLLRFSANSDTGVGFASITVLGYNVTAIIMTQRLYTIKNIQNFSVILIIAFIFSVIGKLLLLGRIKNNFLIASAEDEKYSAVYIEDERFAEKISQNVVIGNPYIATKVKTGFFKKFFHYSYPGYEEERIYKIISSLSSLGSLAVGGIIYYLSKDIFTSVTAVVAISLIIAPFSPHFIYNLPLYLVNKRLNKLDGFISGYLSSNIFYDVNAVALADNDLFQTGDIELHGIKTFKDKRIDEAIIDAAAVVSSSNCILTEIFMNVIDGKTNILPEVDSVLYEDNMGLSAWVNGRRVLLGNRNLMAGHDIQVPSRDYEARFLREGQEIIYLAVAGELSAMFILNYTISDELRKEIERLDSLGVSFIIKSTDPNITPQMLSRLMNIPATSINVISALYHNDYNEIVAPRSRVDAVIGVKGNRLAGFVGSISSAIRLRAAILLGTALQTSGILLGYGILSFIALLIGLDYIGIKELLTYQFFWAFASIVIPLAKKR